MAEGGFDETKSSSNSGTVKFEPVPVGEATITETIPAGYGEPIVFCQAISHSNATFAAEANELAPAQEGRITREVEAGHDLTCLWFNVPSTMPATPDASPAASPAAEGAGSITIAAYNCPAGFDVATVDANPQASCTPAPYTEFDIDDTVDDDYSYPLQTDAAGLGAVSNLPADTYTMYEFVRNGATATFVWDCYDAAGGSNRTDPLGMGNTLSYELAEGAAIRCDWFNVVGGAARVVVAKHGCATSVPAYTLTLEQLRSQCIIDTGRIDFTVVSGTHEQTLPASNNPLTLASFANVPSGSMSVVEKLPGGWGTPIVSCQVLGADGVPIGDARFMEIVVGRQIDFALEPGEVMGCDWFNVTQGPLEVRMIAYTCPADFDAYAYADTPVTLYSYCKGDPGAVKFDTYDGGQYYESRTATAGAPATWLDVPSGELQVFEWVPEGYGRPLVHCEILITDANNNRHVVQQMVEVSNGAARIRQNAPAGQLLQCVWFNVTGASGLVTIDVQACPETIDLATASRIQLETGCTAGINSVDFAVASGSFATTAAATDRFPSVDFPAVPTGDVTVTQPSARNYDTAIVYCYSKVQGNPVTPKERVTVSADLTIARPLAANEWLQCEWYMANTPDGTITVTKWVCPESVTAGKERAYYQAECTQTRDGVDFTVTGTASSSTQTTANGGKAQWTAVQPGLVTIAEHIPDGYGQPFVFCTAPKVNRDYPVTNGTIEHPFYENSTNYLHCQWFNIPSVKGTVVVNKWICPEGTAIDHDAAWYATNCAQPHQGVDFTLTHGTGSVPGTTDASGQVNWAGLPLGPFSIQEHIPTGYDEPVVFCASVGETMLTLAGRVETHGGYLEASLTADAKTYSCSWYNIPAGPNSITIYKYTCPAGYDPSTWGVNPEVDCEEGPNGITFSVAGAATGIQSDTGDAIPYAVQFGELPNGTYTVTEEVPEGIASTFVWDCTGQRMGELRPTPLATGPTLQLTLDGSEDAVCRWYNVPEDEQGRLTIYKYVCSTATYISDADCEIEEKGQGFDLVIWNGDAWEFADTQTTDGGGTISWEGIVPGQYWLDEHDTDWCQMTSEQISDDGNWLNVDAGQETVVKVYNCGGEPGKPGKTPMKYPNTGVPPARDDWRVLP